MILLLIIIPSIIFAQAGDCPSQCITTGGNYSAVNGSIDNELNAVNDGCLTAGEATSSYWLRVCFSSAGTLYMTINPSGGPNNDFDFAVWNGSNCPPTAAPLRCSWAAVGASKLTGLGNGASDNTENAGGDGWLAPINVVNNQCLTIGINNYGNGSNNFTITFTGTTATFTCPSPMPIELLSFTVENIDNENVINWVTASEKDNDYFTIEHSIDGYNWYELIELDAIDGSSGNMYEYIHQNYRPIMNYYRLKQTDYNGISEYFDIIAINNRDQNKYKIYNLIGHEVDITYKGFVIIVYDNGSIKKIFLE